MTHKRLRQRIQTTDAEARLQSAVAVGLGVLFGMLLVAVAAYAMIHGDHKTIDELRQFAQLGLIGIAIWATGKAALKVLSGWKPK